MNESRLRAPGEGATARGDGGQAALRAWLHGPRGGNALSFHTSCCKCWLPPWVVLEKLWQVTKACAEGPVFPGSRGFNITMSRAAQSNSIVTGHVLVIKYWKFG